MFSLNLILAVLLLTAGGYAFYLIKKNRALAAANNLLARELNILINMPPEVAKSLVGPGDGESALGPGGVLNNPALLASILTAMVSKYGNMKIGMVDFDSISKEDYVSVYVDAKSNELILSLNHDLATAADSADHFGFYPKPDDGTYH